jgi:cytochrome c peroxidase
MHDGSMASLEQVLAHYAAGGRVTTSGPNVGDGRRNPYKDPLVSGFALSSGERDDLVAFLESLTDGEFLAEPAFADPQTGP